jgi:hypothetical protein
MADPQLTLSLDGDKKKPEIPGLVGLITERFKRAEDDRSVVENRWLKAYRAYRGEYDPMTMGRLNSDPEASKVYVKITKTKVVAAYGQIIDVLFGSEKFPITIEPTDNPVGIEEFAHMTPGGGGAPPAQPQDVYGYEGDGKSLPPGATSQSLLGGLEDKPQYQGIDWQAGPALDKSRQIQINPAAEAARNMQKVIYDQLDESHAQSALRYSTFEMVMLGTGIMKGPFNYTKTYHNWEKDGESGTRSYKPITKTVPRLEPVSVWNFYPDPAATSIEDCAWTVQRHRLTRSQMRDLMRRPLFNKAAIRAALSNQPNYHKKDFENVIRPTDSTQNDNTRYEVLEYWGVVDRFILDELGLKTDKLDPLDEVQINAWICGEEILRVVLNPFTPNRIPYFACPYEIDQYSIWGVSLPENMEDSQAVMNGHARMAIDNLRFAGNLVFDIDENALVPGQDYKIYAGKIFKRASGQPGQAVHGIKFPNTATENLAMFDKFRQLADEETGIPSYSHGSTGVMSTTRTASGMSMLMGAAALNVKTVIKNVDDFLLRPLGESMFQWNMQFNEDEIEIRGDLEVKARGTASLMQKEVRSQRLMMLLNVASNPQVAPFVKMHTVLKDLAYSLDMDPDKLIATPEEAMLYAETVGKQNAIRGGSEAGAPSGPPGVGGTGSAPAGSNPTDTQGSGAGTIGTGSVPKPGESGFSAAGTGAQGAGAGSAQA